MPPIVSIDQRKFTIDDLNQLNHQIEIAKTESDWKNELIVDAKGKYAKCIDNYILYLRQSTKYKGRLTYNDFYKRKEIDKNEITDFDMSIIRNDLKRDLSLSSRSDVDDALNEVCINNKYNPVVDYLNGVKWDGEKRIEKLFVDLFDADDTPLNRHMTKSWFIAAVKRVYEPGCKFDNMIVLQGGQGIGKSSIDLLSPLYSNTITIDEFGNKDLIDKMNKSWIVIVDELDSYNQKGMASVKNFLSNTKDAARLAYERNTQTFDRHCVFIATTNECKFLRDKTSLYERRFWVIRCKKTTRDSRVRDILQQDYVSQLWAEAVHYYNENPRQYLDIPCDMIDTFNDTMMQYKTLTNDVAIEYVKDMLEKSYCVNKKGAFNSKFDFVNQYKEGHLYDDKNVQKINRIPLSYILYALQEVHKINNKSGDYIEMCLEGKWSLTTIRYCDDDSNDDNGRSCKGFMRKVPCENDNKRNKFNRQLSDEEKEILGECEKMR